MTTTNGNGGQAKALSAAEMLAHMAAKGTKASGGEPVPSGPPVDDGDEAVPVDFAMDAANGTFLLTVQFDPKATYRRPWVKKEGRWGYNRIVADTGWASYDLGDGYSMEFKLMRKSDEARQTSAGGGLRSAVRRK